jgi:hypothetical protein
MSNVLEWLVGLLQCRHRFFPLCFSLSLMLVTAEGSVAAQSATSTQTNPSGTQTYAITAKVIAGGGTMIARSPCFELAGTIGQPAAGPSQSATYALNAGFWGAPARTDTLFRSSFEACQP